MDRYNIGNFREAFRDMDVPAGMDRDTAELAVVFFLAKLTSSRVSKVCSQLTGEEPFKKE